jgi:hypothetical protein
MWLSNYLGPSIGGSHGAFVSIFTCKVLVTKYLSLSIGGRSDEALDMLCT